MGNIDWLPIAELPEAFKDGRAILLWDGDCVNVGYWEATDAFWHSGPHISRDPTHFAEINEP